MTLRYDFASYSPGSRRLIDYQEAGEEALLVEEVRRTLAAHRAAAPQRVERGAMTRDEADRIAAILAAIADDLAAEPPFLSALRAHFAAGGDVAGAPRSPIPRAGDAFTWEDKLHVLRRELHFRRRYDPDRIAKGRLAPAEAARRLERLEAVQDKYWRTLFAWSPPAGAAYPDPAWLAAVREHGEKIDLAAAAAASTQAVTPAKAGAQAAPEHEEALPL